MKKLDLTLPSHLTTLGIRFQVELAPNLDDKEPDEQPTCGITTALSRRIVINSDLDSSRQWKTLFHEGIHAALYVSGVSEVLTDEIEEIIVTTVEHATEQFLLTHGDRFMAALEAQKDG